MPFGRCDEAISNLIHYAASGEYGEIKKLLKSKKVDVNAADEAGVTAMHYAAANNSRETIKILIEYNTDVDARDRNGYTPLHWALINLNYKTIRQLLNLGADLMAEISKPDLSQPIRVPNENALSVLTKNWLEDELQVEYFKQYNSIGKFQLLRAAKYFQSKNILTDTQLVNYISQIGLNCIKDTFIWLQTKAKSLPSNPQAFKFHVDYILKLYTEAKDFNMPKDTALETDEVFKLIIIDLIDIQHCFNHNKLEACNVVDNVIIPGFNEHATESLGDRADF